MQTSHIENLSSADLKDQRAEIVSALKASPPDDLADRYVQARLDAKSRDDKLSEQGQTITTLNEALGLAKGEIERLCGELQAANSLRKSESEQAGNLIRSSAEIVENLRAEIAGLRHQLASETARADRLKNAAGRMHAASAKAAQQLNEALSAQAIAAADEGQ